MINAQVAAQARNVRRNNIINISSRLSAPAILVTFVRRSFYLWIHRRVLEGFMGGKLSYVYLKKGDYAGSLGNFNAFFKLDPRNPEIARVKTIIKPIGMMKK